MPDGGWATPGVTFPRPAVEPPADVVALTGAVEQALSVDPSLLPPDVAVGRAEALLALRERLAAAALRAVADVDARDAWSARAAGSTRTWLRTLPCGDRGQLATARALDGRERLAAALAAGTLSVRTATTLARQLDRVPARVEREQLEGVLVDGVGDLLGVWTGAACLEPTEEQEREFDRRRARLAGAVRCGLDDCWSDPAGQLEPALVLAAEVLTPAEVEAGVAVLVDALQPEADLDARAQQEHSARDLVLRRLKGGGWSLRAHLTDETGQLLHDALEARRRRHPLEPASPPAAVVPPVDDLLGWPTAAPVSDDAPTGAATAEDVDAEDVDAEDVDAEDVDAATATAEDEHAEDVDAEDLPDGERIGDDPFGATGPGTPLDPRDVAVQGTPLPSAGQRAHDALAHLLADLVAVHPGTGARAPARLTVVARLDALAGAPGAPPGVLRTPSGDVPLTRARLQGLACGALLSAVLVDARGRPVGASGEHRHATARERRAMTAAWGSSCAVNGCTLRTAVPHHVEPFALSRRTVLRDLVPLCEHHHHDVHEGHRTLRLRDHRLIDDRGWSDGSWTALAQPA